MSAACGYDGPHERHWCEATKQTTSWCEGVPYPTEPTFQGYPDKIINRILWNERGGEIDEIVISNCTVHIEQMSDNCWWIGITRADGGYWAGNFHAKKWMTFTEQEMDGFEWDADDAHRERS